MSARIDDYAMIGDGRTAALVSREGSIDWFCAPRFDSASLFGALLGDEGQGCWTLRPRDPAARATRSYEPGTFVLVTRWEGVDGIAEVRDFLAVDGRPVDLVRRVTGVEGAMAFVTTLRVRFDYARVLPWVRQVGDEAQPALHATGGPDALLVRGVRLRSSDHVHEGDFTVRAGESVDLVASWYESYLDAPEPLDAGRALDRARSWWGDWARALDKSEEHAEEVVRSLLVLRALTHRDTGGVVAAVTTSLPELPGGARNWDYRYVWLRDASLTLETLIDHGSLEEADRWRRWLLRAVAGDPARMQIMYGVAGERDLTEREMPSLPGYQGAAPVRVGNAAVGQYQADVVGEVMVALEAARLAGLAETPFSWALQRALLDRVASAFDTPDAGMWEIRGEPRMFTESRVMMWAAFDRGVRAIETRGLDGPLEVWRTLRDRLRDEVDEKGVDPEGGYFVQSYGSREVDASLLLLPQVGFCAADDPRMLATVAEIERSLMRDGFVLRYRTEAGVDGLEGEENPFLACSFWLVEQYVCSGRREDAHALMDRLCAVANDVGLLSEEWDPRSGRQTGNVPQAFSHLALVSAADALSGLTGRGAHRG